MKRMLLIALTAVLLGSTTAKPPHWFSRCFGRNHDDTKEDKDFGAKHVIEPCKLPAFVLKSQITLDGSNCGNKFNATDFTEMPTVQWSGAQPNSSYTFLLYNNMPKLLWGVSNIPGTALLGDGNITGYAQLNGYIAPRTDGLNDICKALLYQQTKPIDPDAAMAEEIERKLRGFQKFVKFYHWQFARDQKLCGPLAGLEAIFSS